MLGLGLGLTRRSTPPVAASDGGGVHAQTIAVTSTATGTVLVQGAHAQTVGVTSSAAGTVSGGASAATFVGEKFPDPSTGSNSTPRTYTFDGLSAGAVQDGDFAVFAVLHACTNQRTHTTNTAGWDTHATIAPNDSQDASLTVFTKVIADAATETSIEIAYSGILGTDVVGTYLGVWRPGTGGTLQLDVAIVDASAINSCEANPGAITPVTAGAQILAIGVGASGSLAPADPSIGAGYDASDWVKLASGSRSLVAFIGRKAWDGAGAFDPPAMTCSTTGGPDSWAAATLAIRPA